MLDKQSLTLAHPDVQAAKQRFEKGKNNRKIPYSFEELFEYFKADCVRFSTLADDAGVERQAVHQIYNKYFRSLFDGKSGMERKSACTLEHRLVRIEQVKKKFEEDPVLKLIAEKALAAGCTVEAVPYVGEGHSRYSVRSGRLIINDYRCAVSHLKTKSKSPRSQRWLTSTSLASATLEEVEYLIIYTTIEDYPEHMFIVPAPALRTYVQPGKASFRFYVPTEKLPIYRNNIPRINWWKHEDAWHLLTPKPKPAS